MQIDICKWYQGADAPVIFMIDDFCNVWVDSNKDGIVDLGEDWGYAKRGHGSSLGFLEEKILDKFPAVKVTFFVPVGIRAGVVRNSEIPCISRMTNNDAETVEFFRSVAKDPRYEFAYHGTTHGIPGEKADDFIQEWVAYKNLDEAMETIKKGKEIFNETFGYYPRGGKYCGYEKNSFSDESVEKSGFKWWCRNSTNNSISDIGYFGEKNLVDIPTTISGLLLNSILYPGPIGVKSIVKRIFKRLLIRKKLLNLDHLINRQMVVSIQEHIAPSRNDGMRQIPNIIDDVESLLIILQYIERKRVWYCTCSGLADYVLARDNITLGISTDRNDMTLIGAEEAEGKTLTLKIGNNKVKRVLQPDGTEKQVIKSLVDVNVMQGTYFFG